MDELKQLNEEIERFCNNSEKLIDENILFLDIASVQKITGWSKKTVEDLFNHPDFPCTDLGKRKLVLKVAFIKFFMQRRCRDEKDYWHFVA
ncbi:MAG: hypothetical protein IKF64_03635 [Eubacterium sp.]|nr:hypothetical protein [Eubacterium sp.]